METNPLLFVVDFSPDLFWHIGNVTRSENFQLRHILNIKTAEEEIIHDLPALVLVNADHLDGDVNKFMSKIRTHVFARQTMFVVFTANPEFEFTRSLIISGATYVFNRDIKTIQAKEVLTILKWCLDYKNLKESSFTASFLPYEETGEVTTWGRLGFITKDYLLIEANIDLNEGESLLIDGPLFEELGIKNAKFQCVAKNPTGKYYQYTNSYLGMLKTDHPERDPKAISAFIENNKDTSKAKPIKVVYFEDGAHERLHIASVVKMDKRYSGRGYSDAKDFVEIIKYQSPHLIFINERLLVKNKMEVKKSLDYLKEHHAVVVAYRQADDLPLDKADNEALLRLFPQLFRVERPIDEKLLEGMTAKLEAKLTKDHILSEEEFGKRLTLNKHSAYSRVSFQIPIHMTQISEEGITLESPIKLSLYCGVQINSISFSTNRIGRLHLFRVVGGAKNKGPQGYKHQFIFIALNLTDQKNIEHYLEEKKKPTP